MESNKKEKPMKLMNKIRSRMSRFNKKMDNYQEAVTFAQAGEYGHANRVIADSNTGKTAREKLLVIGNGSTFASHIVSYALEMATRLSYDIVALNTAPVFRDHMEAFRNESVKNAESFRRNAEQAGVPLTHVVKFASPDRAMLEIQQDQGGVDFVISDESSELSADQQEKRESSRLPKQCYVYSIT